MEKSLLQRVTPGRTANLACWTIVRGTLPAMGRKLRPIWEDESSSLSIAGDGPPDAPTFVVTYDEMAQFTIAYATREIHIEPIDGDISDATIEHLLVDQIWPRILANDGHLVLHAAAVARGKSALLFVGRSGLGKSTLSASLHRRGFELLGDDAVLIAMRDGEARCSAVYRSLRLFPDSIATLIDASVSRTDVADYTDKQNVHLPPGGQLTDEAQVRAIFFLGPDSGTDAELTAISPGDACMRLVEHSFWLDPTDLALTARKLSSASALASAVPVFQLDYPREFAALPALHEAIFGVLPDGVRQDTQVKE